MIDNRKTFIFTGLPEPMNEAIETAIEAMERRSCLSVTYGYAIRIVEPFALGVTKRGNYVLRVYQTSSSDKPDDVGWRLLSVKDIQEISVLPGLVKDRPDYTPDDSVMAKVIYQL